MMTSALHVISIGVAAENVQEGGVLEIVPVELMPLVDGVIDGQQGDWSASGLDNDGAVKQVSVKTSRCIKATWLGRETNRVTPPDVQRGETVEVWQYGDTDTFYWTSLGRKDDLRRLETVRWFYSNESDPEKNVVLTEDNAYMVEISTHTKRVAITTNKNDGEQFAYSVEIHAGENYMEFKDDAGNVFRLDSGATHLLMQNADGSNFHLNKKNITAFAPDSITMEASKNISLKAGVSMLFECVDATINAAASLTVNSPQSTFNGNVTIAGMTSMAGGGTSPNMNVTDLTVSTQTVGSLQASSIQTGSINPDSHSHP